MSKPERLAGKIRKVLNLIKFDSCGRWYNVVTGLLLSLAEYEFRASFYCIANEGECS